MTTERGEPNMRSNIIFGRDLLFSLVIPIIAICFLSIIMGQAFAQEASQNYIIRRVEIWSLFYRGMTAAFVVFFMNNVDSQSLMSNAEIKARSCYKE